MIRLSWPKVKVTRSKVKVTYAVMQNSCFGYNSWTDEWILMILRHMVDIDETLKLTQGQGHKVKDQGHIWSYVKLLFSYKSWTDDSILMILVKDCMYIWYYFRFICIFVASVGLSECQIWTCKGSNCECMRTMWKHEASAALRGDASHISCVFISIKFNK